MFPGVLTTYSTLHSLSYQTIHLMYGLNIELVADDSQLISHALDLQQRLQNWRTALPPDLDPYSPNEVIGGHTAPTRLRVTLSLRYLNLKLMIHRPFLSRMLQDLRNPGTQLITTPAMSPMLIHVMRPCVSAAKDTVDLVAGVLKVEGTGRQMPGAWWFVLHYRQ